MPFGPPYKPVVTAFPGYSAAQIVNGKPTGVPALEMSLSIVGSTGEVCTNLLVNGGRPPKPEFTITDPKGKVVQQGTFEYG